MLPNPKQATGDAPARPADDLVPEAARIARGRVQAARLLAGAAARAGRWSRSRRSRESARRLLYLGALVLRLGVHRARGRRAQSAPRRWTGIAVGTGSRRAR